MSANTDSTPSGGHFLVRRSHDSDIESGAKAQSVGVRQPSSRQQFGKESRDRVGFALCEQLDGQLRGLLKQ